MLHSPPRQRPTCYGSYFFWFFENGSRVSLTSLYYWSICTYVYFLIDTRWSRLWSIGLYVGCGQDVTETWNISCAGASHVADSRKNRLRDPLPGRLSPSRQTNLAERSQRVFRHAVLEGMHKGSPEGSIPRVEQRLSTTIVRTCVPC